MTQHMQLRVSTTAVAEHRHELSHSHREGSAAAVPHAAHRHRPHTTQMMDSEPGERPGPVSGGFMSGIFGSGDEESWGGEVITDGGLVWGTGDTVMGRWREALRPECRLPW